MGVSSAFGINPTLYSKLPQIKAGKLRGLGIASKTRSPFLPELPIIAESGYPGFAAVGWIGIVAPAKWVRATVDPSAPGVFSFCSEMEKENFGVRGAKSCRLNAVS